MTRVYGAWSPLADRLRHAMLMEYLSVRRLREDARNSLKRADAADAEQAKEDGIRAASDPYFHPYRAQSQMAGHYHREYAKRTQAMAGGLMDGVAAMQSVLKGGY